jgi:hypothetical protein
MENTELNNELEQYPQTEQGKFSKPIITQHLVESFDNFRLGMDKLASVYPMMEQTDPELYRKLGRFGETMTKMIEGYAKLVEQQGGEVGSITKPEALKKYIGSKELSTIGLNEDKEEIHNCRLEHSINRINDIIKGSKK